MYSNFFLRGRGNCAHAIISVLVLLHQPNFHCPKGQNILLLWARQIEFKLKGVQVFSFADHSSMTWPYLSSRVGRIVYGLPWDTNAEDVLMRIGWDSLETKYKLRLTEFVFVKCLKGYTVTEFKDLFLQRNSGRRRNENIILPRPETNFIRNSIRFRGAIAWNTWTNKETRAKTLKEFKRCLVKFDIDKMNFESILATTKNRDIGYEYF